MSSDEAAALVDYYSSHQTNSYCALASAVLFFYECVITFTDEVNLFWSQKLTGASALFFLNRWAIILYGVFTLITGFTSNTISPEVCPRIAKADLVIGLLQYFPWAVFSGLRALGVTRNWPFSVFILMLSFVPFAINLSAFHFHPTGMVVPELGCVYTEDMSEQTAKILTIVSRVSLITADVLLGLATWYKLSAGHKFGRMKAGTFAYTLLMDGTIYFIALSLLNTLHLVLTLLSFGTQHENVSVVTDFTEPLTGVLVSRFLMDLQSANRRALNTDSSLYDSPGDGPLESIVFERVVGSLASTISVPGEDEGESVHGSDPDGSGSGTAVHAGSEGETLVVEEVRRRSLRSGDSEWDAGEPGGGVGKY
ncbi:hypothetical protein L226DRAFT_536655 [Lentinus tigrinus ALCF2SS1-7]|uniref:DUF6533 domain-containing protein n=1 Tax=Lentinus tigrinus ALCF2SS1-6 TaxID=1328759 RepID=A0A5C2S2Y8_9APHY|nr:hypothetical protein L227DRAFT_578094 [Lentinus tigrinus ALCF2SS1-6]RPD73163.1 hypothetical protein L226DRAFT_536655 [Lentinus tigrinus ALCF2SS1-7]